MFLNVLNNNSSLVFEELLTFRELSFISRINILRRIIKNICKIRIVILYYKIFMVFLEVFNVF